MTIDESLLTQYAREHNLEFAKNPFHASHGFELRRRDKVIESIGFLFGENSVEVYRRRSDRVLDLVHRRLWFAEWILRPLVWKKKKRDSYEVLQRLSLEGFGEAEAIDILERCFGPRAK